MGRCLNCGAIGLLFHKLNFFAHLDMANDLLFSILPILYTNSQKWKVIYILWKEIIWSKWCMMFNNYSYLYFPNTLWCKHTFLQAILCRFLNLSLIHGRKVSLVVNTHTYILILSSHFILTFRIYFWTCLPLFGLAKRMA